MSGSVAARRPSACGKAAGPLAAAAGVAFAFARIARGDDAAAPPVVVVDVATSCAEGATLRDRLGALRPVPGGKEPPKRVQARVAEAGGTFVGEVRVTYADGTETSRSFASVRCDEVSDAIELVTTLAFGLDARAIDRAPPPVVPAPRDAEADKAVPPPRERTRWRFTGALRGDLVSGVGTGVQVGPDVALGAFPDRRGPLAPTVELSFLWTTSGAETVPQVGTVTLTLTRGAVTGCPVRLTLASGLSVKPCVEVAAGVIAGTATGLAVTAGTSAHEPWLAIAPLARVEWAFGRHLGVMADAGPDLRVLHDQFVFVPSGTVARDVPRVGSIVRAGLMATFP